MIGSTTGSSVKVGGASVWVGDTSVEVGGIFVGSTALVSFKIGSTESFGATCVGIREEQASSVTAEAAVVMIFRKSLRDIGYL